MKNILIPVDGSEYSARALEMGKALAAAYGSDITILNVVRLVIRPTGRIHYNVSEFLEETKKSSEEMLAESKNKFTGMDNKVTTVSIEGDDAAKVIVDYANEINADLVVMGSRGLGAVMDRILTGSVTTKVLHHINKPVLVVK